jgi:ectoine hydroxylase-related dioxygenase (phytanoyl-CoA dioxygenase family)
VTSPGAGATSGPASFDGLVTGRVLPPAAERELRERGFTVIPGAVAGDRIARLAESYDTAVASAAEADVARGRTTTRVTDFATRGTEFESLFLFPPLLDACWRVIGAHSKLSSMHARTLRPRTPAQELHADVSRDSDARPLVGFIVMVDAFTTLNGATRFVPGSHLWEMAPEAVLPDARSPHRDEVQACGPAGSLIVFDGSAWHGHAANATDEARRSIQGAFIPRSARAATDFGARVTPVMLSRLDPLSIYLLDL